MMTPDKPDADILILGAGMAGLAAARTLSETGLRVLVLEAQDRVGGRILTQRVGHEVIELGAEFIHGRPPELLALIEEAGLHLVERTGSRIHATGSAFTADEDSSNDQQEPFALLDRLEDFTGPDLTFAEFLDRENIPADRRNEIIRYVEGFNAADHCTIGAAALGFQQKAEDSIDGDRSFHILGGYDQLSSYLASRIAAHGGLLRLDTRVHALDWAPGRVTASTNHGEFSAKCATVTTPIGVLQSHAIHFHPPLPENIANCLSPTGPIRTGHVIRITLHFRERFWITLPKPSLPDLSFLFTPDNLPSVWWTQHPERSTTLTGWIGGPRSESLSALGADSLAGIACETLAQIFHRDPSDVTSLLLGHYIHNWTTDPNFCGAYSYIASGGLDAPGLLATPVADTLYFAGEHTDTTGHWGTVHAAFGSGLRATDQVLQQLLP